MHSTKIQPEHPRCSVSLAVLAFGKEPQGDILCNGVLGNGNHTRTLERMIFCQWISQWPTLQPINTNNAMTLITCDTHSLIRYPQGVRIVEHQAGKGQAPVAHQIQMFIVLNEEILRFTTCQSVDFGGAFLRSNILKRGLNSIKLDHMCSN